MLTFTTAAALRAEPDPRRFWHLAVLTAVRDGAERLELRFGDGDATLYHRVSGRDWELAAVDDELFPHLKPTLREVARLVAAERPDLQFSAVPADGRYEPAEVGWLTYDLGGRLLDCVVRIDPQEPWGMVTVELDADAEAVSAAADALAAYYADEPA
jgi:hypothetical protein